MRKMPTYMSENGRKKIWEKGKHLSNVLFIKKKNPEI